MMKTRTKKGGMHKLQVSNFLPVLILAKLAQLTWRLKQLGGKDGLTRGTMLRSRP